MNERRQKCIRLEPLGLCLKVNTFYNIYLEEEEKM